MTPPIRPDARWNAELTAVVRRPAPPGGAQAPSTGHRTRRQARPRMGPPGAPFPTSKYGPADGLGVTTKGGGSSCPSSPDRHYLPQRSPIASYYLLRKGKQSYTRFAISQSSSMILELGSLRCRPVGCACLKVHQ